MLLSVAGCQGKVNGGLGMPRVVAFTVDSIRSSDQYDGLVGLLSQLLSFRPLEATQIDAWVWTKNAIGRIAHELPPSADDWLVLFEHSAPLSTTRCDVVFVTHRYVFCIEVKSGAQVAGVSAREQAAGYANDLYYFHPGARARRVVPVVLTSTATGATSASLPEADPELPPGEVLNVTTDGLAALLREEATSTDAAESFDHEEWLAPRWFPRPTIVEAAVSMVAQADDPGLITALADDKDLETLRSLLVRQVHDAAAARCRHLIVVTGTPGAGKTLVGLRMAHDPSVVSKLRDVDALPPLYLSGNAPLVAVLVEALARDARRRTGSSMADARRNAQTLVKLVHEFTRSSASNDDAPAYPHVVIFDEGQRAWDAAQVRRKVDRFKQADEASVPSEPELILSLLETRDWAVAVVLAGTGQEINTGETGVELWLEAAARRAALGRSWRVQVPPTLAESAGVAESISELHLAASKRAVLSPSIARWVDAVLGLDAEEALSLVDQQNYPIKITRDLAAAKAWLKTAGRRSRIGLVASAKAGRLRAYGVETHADLLAGVEWENWFLDRLPSLASSSALEVPATEFKCQGLELDYVGICWSWDFVIDPAAECWRPQTLDVRAARWKRARSQDKLRFARNAYRVLLTRARHGMVIWVPPGAADDRTRPAADMDEVFAFLSESGAETLALLP